MMMNDLREAPMPPAEMGSTPKIVAALVVALGFGAIGAYSYETGTWNSAPKQIVASKETPPPAPVDNTTASEAPLQSVADLPPAPPPAPAPVKDVPAQASAKAAAAPAIKVARAQAPEPSLSQAPAVQPAATISAQASPEAAAPAASIPEPPAAEAAATSAPVTAPPQEAPAQQAPAEATPPAGP